MSEPSVQVPISVLSGLVDPDPCWFDHHGGCQAHGFLDLAPGEVCPNAQAQALLDSRAAVG